MVDASEYTGPSDFVHLHNHTVFSTLDGVATPLQYAEECKKRGYPAMAATEHGTMASVPDMYLEFKKVGVKYVAGCFLPNQPILLREGIKPISEVNAGDYAITDRNRPRRILNLQRRHYDGEMVRIKAWGVEDQVATPEHPFLVREIDRNLVAVNRCAQTMTLGMRKAGDLIRQKYTSGNNGQSPRRSGNQKQNYRFYLCVPRPKPGNVSSLNTIDWICPESQEVKAEIQHGMIEKVSYSSSGYATTKVVNLPSTLPLSDDLLWIMGLWLAEGTTRSALYFHLGGDEYPFYERIADYFAGFGITTSFNFRSDRYALDVTVNSSYFARMFQRLFGSGHENKRIPWLFLEGLGVHGSKRLLDGLFDGDAKICPDQSSLKLANHSLVWQARFLLARLGKYSAITPLAGRNTSGPSWSVRRQERGRCYYDWDDNYLYLPVYDVSKEAYSGPVFNIEVEEDNTYNTGVAVHNCEVYFNDHHREAVQRRSGGFTPQRANQSESPADWSDYIRFYRSRHVTLLAKNQTGFENLIKLTTEANRQGTWRTNRPGRLWLELIAKHKEGLIVLSGCLNGPVAYELRRRRVVRQDGGVNKRGKTAWKIKEQGELLPLKERWKNAAREFLKWKEVIGRDYYVELQTPVIMDTDHSGSIIHKDHPYLHDMVDLETFNLLVQLADASGVPMVLANDCHYLRRQDALLQRLMMAIEQDLDVTSPDLFASNSSEQFMKTRGELWATWRNYPYHEGKDDGLFERMCDNTLMIADQCKPLSMNADPKIPVWKDADRTLREWTHAALKERGLDKVSRRWLVDGRWVTHAEQAEIELDRFISKGFASYFLITSDLVRYGRSKGYPFGPRGSAGGSLVCMLLGIHPLNPLKWGLSFDRFMSPSRGGYMLKVKMPEPIN